MVALYYRRYHILEWAPLGPVLDKMRKKKPTETTYGEEEEEEGKLMITSSRPTQIGERLRPHRVMEKKKEKKASLMFGAMQAHTQNNGITLQTISQMVMIGPTTLKMNE